MKFMSAVPGFAMAIIVRAVEYITSRSIVGRVDVTTIVADVLVF